MPNITLSIEEKLLKAGREYAKKHHTSLNAMIRKYLSNTVLKKNSGWIDVCFDLMDQTEANSHGKAWRRQELYDV